MIISLAVIEFFLHYMTSKKWQHMWDKLVNTVTGQCVWVCVLMRNCTHTHTDKNSLCVCGERMVSKRVNKLWGKMNGCSVLRQKGPVFIRGGVTNVNRKWVLWEEGPANDPPTPLPGVSKLFSRGPRFHNVRSRNWTVLKSKIKT